MKNFYAIALCALVSGLLCAQSPQNAAVQPKYALVIGNGAYTGSLNRLANPVNDAHDVGAALRNLGACRTCRILQ